MNLKYQKFIISIILCLAIIGFFDKTLAIGLIFISFLCVITFLIINKNKEQAKILGLLFLLALLVHLAAVLFVHYADFQPFSGGGGDYTNYNYQAQEIARRIHQGNFSLEGLKIGHRYPVIIGYIYAFTTPEMLIGQLFSAWLAVISVLLTYLIVLEISGSKKWAFLIGLIVCLYPSYLFYGSLLLKDTLVIPLVLIGLLLTLKLIKNFSWRNFVIFYIVLGAVIHFRFYVGYALLFTFIPCWLLLSKLNLKKKFIQGIIIIILLGFVPQFLGHGYYGFNAIKGYLNPKTLIYYREIVYAPVSSSAVEVPETSSPETSVPETSSPETSSSETSSSETSSSETSSSETSSSETSSSETSSSERSSSESFLKKLAVKVFPNIEKEPSAHSSSIEVKTEVDNPSNFLINYSKSFIYVLLGPLPWQIQNYRQLFVLLETIPWYFLLFFVIKGAFITLKRRRIALPLLVFSIILLGVLALFINNFGIITRIRIPSFIALLCLIPLSFKKS